MCGFYDYCVTKLFHLLTLLILVNFFTHFSYRYLLQLWYFHGASKLRKYWPHHKCSLFCVLFISSYAFQVQTNLITPSDLGLPNGLRLLGFSYHVVLYKEIFFFLTHCYNQWSLLLLIFAIKSGSENKVLIVSVSRLSQFI